MKNISLSNNNFASASKKDFPKVTEMLIILISGIENENTKETGSWFFQSYANTKI